MRKSVTLAEQNTVFSLRGWTKQTLFDALSLLSLLGQI